MQIGDLPDEILSNILVELDIPTIESLCRIPSLRKRITGLFTIVSDKVDDLKADTSIPTESFLPMDEYMLNGSNSLAVHFVLGNIRDPQGVQNVEKSQHTPNSLTIADKVIERFGDFEEFGIYGSTNREKNVSPEVFEVISGLMDLTSSTNVLKSIRFDFVTTLRLLDAQLNPVTLEFPSVKFLSVENCTPCHLSQKLYIPRLETLQLIDGCQAIFKVIDLKNLHELFIASSDIGVIENASFPELEILSILPQRNSLKIFRNIVAPKLNRLYMKGVELVENIDASNLQSMKLLETKTMKGLCFQNVVNLSLLDVEVDLDELNCPNVEELNIDDSTLISTKIAPHSLFENLTSLKGSSMGSWLDSLALGNLDTLEISFKSLDEYETFSTLEFPKLNYASLDFSFDCDGIELGKFPKTPILNHLTLMKIPSPRIFQLQPFDNLEFVDLYYPRNAVFKNIRLDTMKRLIMYAGESLEKLEFEGCSFNSLLQWNISTSRAIQRPIPATVDRISAPMLQSMNFELRFDYFDLSSFPSINRVVLFSVKNFTLKNIATVKYTIEIAEADELRELYITESQYHCDKRNIVIDGIYYETFKIAVEHLGNVEVHIIPE